MKKRLLAAVTVFVFAFAALLPSGAMAAQKAGPVERSLYGDTKDVDAKIKADLGNTEYREAQERKIRENAAKLNSDEASASEAAANDGDFTFDGGTKIFLDYETSFVPFTLRSVGEKVEIWVADDLSFPEGDSRPAHVITQAQVDRMAEVFDNTVYVKDTDFFGTPDSHNGQLALLSQWGYLPENYYTSEDGSDKVIILVDNVKDEQYYDPAYPFFVAGFYSPSFEGYMDRNIITIDSKDWAARLDNTYLPTEAHEFQHLIHDDNDPDEESWVNEGMADFAEYLCFGEHPWSHINFFLAHPENSLVSWDDQYAAETGPETLADYGQAYLVQLYLNDHYGKEFVRALAKDEESGIAGVNKVLGEFGAGIDFKELFRRFTIAVAIDSPQPENGIYNFSSIDLNVNYQSALAFDKDGVPAWGGDYKVLDNAKKIQSLKIDGVEYLPSPWKVVDDPLGSGEKVFWGNSGNELSNRLIFKADLRNLTSASAALKFDHYYNIEEQWDFGMVQVSADNGATWESLSNANTRSDLVPAGYPAISENLPGFTGTNGAWTNETFDISTYIGKEILVCFNYMTDWGYNEAGWYVDNIEIPEIGFKHDCSTTDGTYSLDGILGRNIVQYAVTFINRKSLGKGSNMPTYRVLSVDPFSITEAQSLELRDFFSGGENYAVIWYAAQEGIKGVADYSYQITTKSDYNKNKKN